MPCTAPHSARSRRRGWTAAQAEPAPDSATPRRSAGAAGARLPTSQPEVHPATVERDVERTWRRRPPLACHP
eukprot:6765158-Pyramimonas_sp.AAC.1